MNIFKILSSGDGSINEPNVSSFLAYLLDPNEGHGLESKVLERLLSPLVVNNADYFKEIIYKSRISDLSKDSRFKVIITTEVRVESNIIKANKRRDIDILIEIYENSKVPKYVFCIENKINDGAINENQLIEEIDGMVSYYRKLIDESIDLDMPKIGLIYLTPDYTQYATNSFQKYLKQLAVYNKGDVRSIHMIWNNSEEADNIPKSVFYQLSDLLRLESFGLIDPIHEYTKYTIKSFMNFIATGFTSYIEEKQNIAERSNYGKTVKEYYQDVYTELEYDKEVSKESILSMVSSKVNDESGKGLKDTTNKAHLSTFTINEPNRQHYNVKSPVDDSKNLFYYVDSKKNTFKKFDCNNPPENVKIYWSENGKKLEGYVTEFYPKKG